MGPRGPGVRALLRLLLFPGEWSALFRNIYMYLSPQPALRLRTGEGHVALPVGGVLDGVPQH